MSVSIILFFNKMSYLSISQIVEVHSPVFGSWKHISEVSVEIRYCPAVDNTAKSFSLSWALVFCQNVLIQFSIKKHLSFSTVVIGTVIAIFRNLTVGKIKVEFFCVRNCNKQWHLMLFRYLSVSIKLVIMFSI